MLKPFDIFRRIQTDQQLVSTTGGCLTLFAIITASFLIYYSLLSFWQEQYHTFLVINNDNSTFLPMRIDITFNRMPCSAIAIEFSDQMEFTQSNLENKLSMYDVDVASGQKTQYKRESYAQEQNKLMQAIKMQKKCRLNGILPLPKTPGTLIFAPIAHQNLLLTLQKGLRQKTSMNYRIDSLQFGLGDNSIEFPIAKKSKQIQNYIKQLEADYQSKQFVQDFTKSGMRVDYYNHLKIIPVKIQHNDNKSQGMADYQKYRYSLRAGQAPPEYGDPAQTLIFFTEIQPINILYRKHQPQFYDLAVQILAIVGGTVATLGLLNSISHFLLSIKQ